MARAASYCGFACILMLLPSERAAAEETVLAKATAFFEQRCLDCHSGDGAEAGLKLDQLSQNLDERKTFLLWNKIHDKVERGEMPPVSAAQPAAAEKQAFLKTIAELLARVDRARQAKSGRTVLRRLNRVEYDYTLRDLLAVPHWDGRDMLPSDPLVHGFDVVCEALPMSYVQQSAFLQAAEAALKEALVLQPRAPSKKYQADFLDLPRFGLGKGVPKPADNLALTNTNLPTLFFGGGFRHGQHLAFNRTNNYPLCNLFVSMLQRLGIEADKFASSTGTMRGLQ